MSAAGNVRQTTQTVDDVFSGGGEMGALMRCTDWTATVLGSAEVWPASLKTAVNIALNSRFPIVIFWGRQFSVLYNDGYIPILGAKHPSALATPAEECWNEIWDIIGPMLNHVLNSG